MSLALTANDLIVVHQNQPRTTSKKVSEVFGKQHRNVLRRIDEIVKDQPEWAAAHFRATEEAADKGASSQKHRIYEMDRDGFSIVAMGFTGKKALEFKIAFINAFNEMAEKLFGQPKAGLTPAQQRHIQKRVGELAHIPGNSFSSVYGSIKNQFQVGTYKDVPADQYPKLCDFLQCEPLEGEYIEAEPPSAKLTEEQSKRISCIKTHSSGLKRKLSAFMKSAMETSKPEKRDELARHYREVREHAHVIDSQSEGLLNSGVTHDIPETERAENRATLTQVDLAILYGFSMSALQLVDMGERLKPAIDALKPLSLFGVDARLETCRQSIGWLHDKVGAEMEAAAKESGLYKDYVDLRAAKDRSRPIITLDD